MTTISPGINIPKATDTNQSSRRNFLKTVTAGAAALAAPKLAIGDDTFAKVAAKKTEPLVTYSNSRFSKQIDKLSDALKPYNLMQTAEEKNQLALDFENMIDILESKNITNAEKSPKKFTDNISWITSQFLGKDTQNRTSITNLQSIKTEKSHYSQKDILESLLVFRKDLANLGTGNVVYAAGKKLYGMEKHHGQEKSILGQFMDDYTNIINTKNTIAQSNN